MLHHIVIIQFYVQTLISWRTQHQTRLRHVGLCAIDNRNSSLPSIQQNWLFAIPEEWMSAVLYLLTMDCGASSKATDHRTAVSRHVSDGTRLLYIVLHCTRMLVFICIVLYIALLLVSLHSLHSHPCRMLHDLALTSASSAHTYAPAVSTGPV